MIDPLRYRSLQEQLEFDEDNSPMRCWQCLRERVSTPAFFLCHDCGNTGDPRPFCEPCFFDYHLTRRKGKDGHKPHPIVQGDPVTVQTLADGDGTTFAKMHDWVTLDYILTTDESDVAIEDTFLTKQPLTFQSGCSGPCIHLQVFGCTDIAAADIMGASDPYCAVYWKNDFVGVTTTKHMTLNPKWANQTFVLPLAPEFLAVLNGGEGSSVLFNAGALLPKLRIELYDWDRLSKNDFLGQASVSDAEILHILRRVRSGETDENHTINFELKAKQSRGHLGIRVALRGSKLFVHIMEAENVPKADPFSLSDPYCEVYWNDKQIGKTAHINNTLDPVWDLEIFAFKIEKDGPNSVEQSTLRIVCLDWDQFGSDDVLGQIELKGWQIKQLAESKDGNDVVGTADDEAMGEADMENIFDFMQLFQEHEMDEAGLGKMIVGVPEDPNIQKQHEEKPVKEAAAGTETASSSQKKKKRKKKRKDGASAEEIASQRGPGGVEGAAASNEDLMKCHSQVQKMVSSGMEAASSKDQSQTNAEGEKGHQREANAQQEGVSEAAASVLVDDTDQHHCAGTRGCQGEAEVNSATENDELAGPPLDQQRQKGDSVVARGKYGVEDYRDVPVSGEEHTPSADDTKAIPDIPNANASGEKTESSHNDEDVLEGGQNATPDLVEGVMPCANVEKGDGKPNIAANLSSDVSGVIALETEADDKVGDKVLSSPREGDITREPVTESEDQLAQDVASDNASTAMPNADVEKGGGRVEQASATAETRAKRGEKPGVKKSTSCRYRDASIQRFEEDRGILVEYLDDGSSSWVETKFIPRLQIRAATPVARSMFQRLWSHRNKLLNLHKRVLNVKRGMKVLMAVAMTGSRMQWYQLELTDEQSGANFVRGAVDCRFLYHTRGSVLRGLDVAVSHMSLGERARVEVRSDYGFGEVYASRKVPPYATLVFVAQVAAIGHRNAKWLVIRRALQDKVDHALFCLRSHLSSAASSFVALARRMGLPRLLRRGNKNIEELMPDNEESEAGDLGVAAGENGASRNA